MISLGQIRRIALSLAVVACAVVPAFPVSAEAAQKAPPPAKRHSTFILLATTYEFGLPYPQTVSVVPKRVGGGIHIDLHIGGSTQLY